MRQAVVTVVLSSAVHWAGVPGPLAVAVLVVVWSMKACFVKVFVWFPDRPNEPPATSPGWMLSTSNGVTPAVPLMRMACAPFHSIVSDWIGLSAVHATLTGGGTTAHCFATSSSHAHPAGGGFVGVL